MIERILAGLLAAALAGMTIQTMRLHWAQQELADAEIEWATAYIEQGKKVREQERQAARQVAEVAQRYEQERADAERKGNAVVDNLRSGSARFKRLWQGCEAAAARVPVTTGSPAEPDATAELRAESAGRIIRAAAECDAQVSGLQGVIKQWTSASPN